MDSTFVLKKIEKLEKELKFLREYLEHNVAKSSKEDTILYEKLRALRNTIAREEGVSAFVVLYNSVLHEMAEKCPITSEDFRKIKGIGEVKCKKYSERFIECILEHSNT